MYKIISILPNIHFVVRKLDYSKKLQDAPISEDAVRLIDQFIIPEIQKARITIDQNLLIEKEFVNDQCYRYWIQIKDPVQKNELRKIILDLINRFQLNLFVSVVDTDLVITSPKANKETALGKFSKLINIPPNDIYRFGDSSGPYGIDLGLMNSEKSYNVGKEKSVFSKTHNLLNQGPKGVLAVLNCMEPIAIASDLDGTLNSSIQEGFSLDLEEKFGELLNKNCKIAIITGGAERVIPVFSKLLNKLNITSEKADNLILFILNGGLSFLGSELLNLADFKEQYHFKTVCL